MRNEGTILSLEQIDYINHVLEKLYKLDQNSIDKIIVSNTSSIVKNINSSKLADMAYVNNIPMYIPNSYRILNDTREHYTTRQASIKLIADGNFYQIQIDAPAGYSGNYSFVSATINNANAFKSTLENRILDYQRASQKRDIFHYLSLYMDSGDVQIDVTNYDSKIIISYKIDPGTTMQSGYNIEDHWLKITATFFEYGANR